MTISGPVTTSPVRGVDRDDHDDDAFLGEGPPIAQHPVPDVADDAVDVHVAGRNRAPLDLDAVVTERHDVAVLADEHVVVGDTRLAGRVARGARGAGTRRAPG